MRCERKFRIEHLPLEAARQAVRMLPWGMRPLHPDRRIHNIYFDTPELHAFHDNAAGVGERRKYRLRWYGDADWPSETARLEVKKRDLGQGTKEVTLIDPMPAGRLDLLLERLRRLQGFPPLVQPVLHNTYARSYYGSAHPKFRITVDWDLRCRGLLWQTGAAQPASATWLPDPAIILEVKYDVSLDDEVGSILQNWPFRMTKHSKYVRGVELCYGQ